MLRNLLNRASVRVEISVSGGAALAGYCLLDF